MTFASAAPLPQRPPSASLLDSAHDAHGDLDGPAAPLASLPDGEAVVQVSADSSPFHLVLDMELRVLQAGAVLRRILPQLAVRGTQLGEVLAVSQRSHWWFGLWNWREDSSNALAGREGMANARSG